MRSNEQNRCCLGCFLRFWHCVAVSGAAHCSGRSVAVDYAHLLHSKKMVAVGIEEVKHLWSLQDI